MGHRLGQSAAAGERETGGAVFDRMTELTKKSGEAMVAAIEHWNPPPPGVMLYL